MIYKDVKKVIDDYQFSFKKKFGQNFIIEPKIIDGIISKIDIDKDTLVIEIGPGAGSLTSKLCEVADFVLCYEIDQTLKDVLNTSLKNYSNYEIIYGDFLKAKVNDDIKKYNYYKIYVVANLPYYITTPIIMKFIDDKINIQKMAFMVQKEVGNRFKASVGSKDYSSLSIFLNYYFDIQKILDVSRNVFIPKPNVDSIVVMFTSKKDKLYVKNEELFFKLIRDSFKQKRKTIKNNLKDYDLDKIENVLLKHNLSLSSRAEQIPDYVFADIINNYK